MEIKVPYKQINHSQTITQEMDGIFKRLGLDMARHEVVKLEDDPDRQVRVLTIRRRTFIT